jgi:hypothetical protein
MKVTKLIPWPIRVSQALGYFPTSSACIQKNQLLFSFPTFWCSFLLIIIIIVGVGCIYCWEEYTATNAADWISPGDAFTLNVVLGWSYWQTFVIASTRLNILLNRNRMSQLWYNLNELVAPLNLQADSKIRALNMEWSLRLWLYSIFFMGSCIIMVLEETSRLPFLTGLFDFGHTAFGLLHMFSLHTLESCLQIINLAFDSAISTSLAGAVGKKTTGPMKKEFFGSSIHTMVESFWKVEDLVMEFNKVFHHRMVLDISHFLIMEVLLLYFTIRNFMQTDMSIGSCAVSGGISLLFAYSVYSFCNVCSVVTSKSAVYLCKLSKLAKQREGCNNADPLISRRVKLN